ncbi:hypothetical protein Ancab_039273 [Ancistrocladus abbreviatus]
MDSNSSLFLLKHLQRLNLASNNFFPSRISPAFGRLSNLKQLNLSYSGFSGEVPTEIAHLSKLTSLDLSLSDATKGGALEMPCFKAVVSNLTELRELHLDYVSINSVVPRSLANLSSLTSLRLTQTNLLGNWPVDILNSPNLTTVSLSGSQLFGELPSSVNISMLSKLTDFEVGDNNLSGEIPSWLFALPSLRSLGLYENQFTSVSEFVVNSTSLLDFRLDYNRIQAIPNSVFDLLYLEAFTLSNNNLSSTIELSVFSRLKNLRIFDLSYSGLSLTTTISDANSTSSWPSFTYLGLSSCNISEFPDFLRSQENLAVLKLANNKLRGEIPRWLQDFGTETLGLLDLSHNLLTGSLKQLPWKNLVQLDLGSNMFKGPLPIPPPSMTYFTVSNNRFSGEIPASFCNLTLLALLDLSNNSLVGEIPDCFALLISSNLSVMDLRLNQFQGSIPSIFLGCNSYFMTLSLSDNQLEGALPESLAVCPRLEVIDLGNNKLNDTFPFLLGALPNLQVLILRSNNFHGPIEMKFDGPALAISNGSSRFSKLRILDLSNNIFSGALPNDLGNLTSMVNLSLPKGWPYMGLAYYADSILQTVKGVNRKMEEILDSLTIIDVSKNRLEGPIPESVGDLASLRWLNLSHNSLTSHIPLALGKLKVLESLDLSSNQLVGQIPQELVNLNYLEVFNVSENQLVGSIPNSKQFGSFDNSSYLGNPGLCGLPLSRKCGEDEAPPTPQLPAQDHPPSADMQEWEIVLMGYGCGLVIGLVVGCYMFSAWTPLWLLNIIIRLRLYLTQAFWKHCRRHQWQTN